MILIVVIAIDYGLLVVHVFVHRLLDKLRHQTARPNLYKANNVAQAVRLRRKGFARGRRDVAKFVDGGVTQPTTLFLIIYCAKVIPSLTFLCSLRISTTCDILSTHLFIGYALFLNSSNGACQKLNSSESGLFRQIELRNELHSLIRLT